MKTLTVLHRTAAAAAIFAIAALAPIASSEVAQVSSLRLEKSPNASRYVIEQTGSAAYQEFLLNNPKRLVVDIVGARHALNTTTHEGDGKLVTQVRSSQFSNDPDEVTRIVFDLSPNTRYQVSRLGGAVEISFTSDAAATTAPPVMEAAAGFAAWEMDATPKTSNDPVREDTAPEVTSQPTGASTWNADAAQPVSSSDAQPVTESPTAAPEVAAANPWGGNAAASPVRPQSYAAQMSAYQTTAQTSMASDRITMDVQGADIKTVLRSIAEFSNQNIVAGPDVEGPVTVHLQDVPWREALDIVLKANGYGSREEYGIIRVGSLDRLHDEEIDLAQVSQKKEELVPMVTRMVELSFTNAKEMQQAMDKVTTKRGSIAIEKGTNTVIINDIPSVADRIATMVVDLDKKVKQVEIVAKMVDVDVEATREVGIRWDFLNVMTADANTAGRAFSGQLPADPFGGIRLGTVQSWGDVMVALEALERENKANIISNPRITTADNSEANILVGKEIPLIVSDEAGNPITELKKVGVTLRVTPHVNADQTITLDLHPEISELSSQATVQGGIIISLQEADTRVLVRDGETAVIGGLIQEVESRLESGVPGLKDVPLLGALFKYKSTTKKKRELIIFVTPRIVAFDGQG